MKLILSPQDLAINGASPAFEKPLHVGRPNIGSREAFLKYTEEIFDRRWLSNDGPVLKEFEQRIAAHHDVKHCVAMCNGTVALEIAIRALGLEGEVIIPSYTFIATAHALHWQAITPVFADINPVTHTLDPDAVRRMITPRTTGIIGVHLWGRNAPIEALQTIADEHGLKLMFDAAHAFGCSYKGTMVGNFGACEVLSFHATKFFNTFEGGAVLTNNDDLAKTIRLMRNFGFSGVDNVIHPGTNGKMIEIVAAMGMVNLDAIDNVVEANQRNYQAYYEGLSSLPGISLLTFDESEFNSYQYVVMEVCEKCPVTRDKIIQALHTENILARKYFWPGCHNMMPYRELYPHAGLMLANTQYVADRVIVLPTGTAIDYKIVKTVTSVIQILIESES
ncbi:MAG: aminotransferase class I/II-fold pyridoxal phosphate-dependent enzyme [Gammaproteobacteria bacterium]|nr:aminotransferase class I/II-fold pyridoxal phosphate-dependent enzyme [Gammaproteobacteria bacterium]